VTKIINISLSLAALVFAIALACYYVGQEQNIYWWDYAGYWHRWEELAPSFVYSPLETAKGVLHSARTDDYNSLPIVLPAFFKLLPLSSRLSYILALVILYFLPVVALFAAVSCSISGSRDFLYKFIAVSLPLTCFVFWMSCLRGFPDICGLIFILAAILYCSKVDFSQINLKKALILGLLLWAPFLLRRWYAYSIVSLYLSLPVFNYYLNNAHIRLKAVRSLLYNVLAAGFCSILCVIAFQNKLLQRIIETDYASIYSAYQASFSQSVTKSANFIGIWALILGVISLALIFWGGTRKQVLFSLFCLFNLSLSFVLFTQTQSPALQHILPFELWVLLIIAQGCGIIFCRIKSAIINGIISLLVAAVSLWILLHSLFGIKVPEAVNPVMSPEWLPIRVQNYSAYAALEREAEALTGNERKITVLSSSDVFNEEILMSLADDRLRNSIQRTGQVDLRDGINLEALRSDYFIVASPVQLHLSPDGQRVIDIPASEILAGAGIGAAFKRLPGAYPLTDNVTAWIYKKERPFTNKEIEAYFAEFYQFYPSWKSVYDKKLLYAYLTSDIKKGDKWGAFWLNNEGAIYTHPGETQPTVVSWDIGAVKMLQFTSVDISCNIDDIIKLNIEATRTLSKAIDLPKGKQISVDMGPWNNRRSTLFISKGKYSGCDGLTIKAL